MNQLLFYLLQVMAASGLLYGYYHFALRNKKFHRYNRFYLLIAVIISTLVPFFNIPVYFSENETGKSVLIQTLQVISSPATHEPASTISYTDVTTASPQFTAERMIYLFYFLVISFFVSRVLISLNKIRFIIKRNPIERIDKIKFINTDEPGTPFSFFRWLFWNRKIELHSEKGEQIFRHELFHIQQKHSGDIIFMELVSTIFWINPFFHLIKKELKAIHEFLADEFAIKENKNWQYAELLLMQVLNTNNHLVNPFFHNQIKRRIAMITSSTKPSYQYFRKLMVLPIAAIIVTLFAFNYQNKKRIDQHEFEKAMNSITVVVDAGHGGTDAGAKTKDGKITEADLSLVIAKKIESMAHDYNINVIMTREDETFPGGASTKSEALKKRVELVNNVKPSAFIAIHMNTTPAGEQSDKSGFDAYVTKQRSNLSDIRLATIVLKELRNIYSTREEVKQREDAGIFIIDKAKFPSLLLECGYINNPIDLAFISDKKNQELLAKAILKALVTFANSSYKDDQAIQLSTIKNTGDTIPNDVRFREYENYLVVINGVVQPKKGFQGVDSSILFGKKGTSVTVYKDKTGIDKYGQQGKDGVIEITTNTNSGKVHVVVKGGPIPAGKSPIEAELKKWEDPKIYGVWIDASRTSNDDLKKYKPADFGWYDVSKLTKAAVNHGKHDYQVSLYTQKYYDEKIAVKKENSGVQVTEITLVDTTKPIKPQPLIVINGKVLDGLELKNIDSFLAPTDIEKISILKDDTAIAKYGDKAKNGVIEITTKKVTVREVTLTEKKFQDDDIVFSKVEIEASFPGGAEEWRKFLTRNLDPTIPVKNGCKEGTYIVIVQFIVNKDGSIRDVKTLTKHGYGMEEAAMRLIKHGPHWVPGIQNGRNVNAYRKQPITFTITDH